MDLIKFDSSKIRAMLNQTQDATIKKQYQDFMGNNFNIESQDVEKLYPTFVDFIGYVNSGNIKQIVNKKNDSFVFKLMSLKQNARERELRRLTTNFSQFIGEVGHERERQVINFADDLKDIASNINAREIKTDKQSMADAWSKVLHEEMVRRFK